MYGKSLLGASVLSILICSCDCMQAQVKTASDLLARLDHYCSDKVKDGVDPKDKSTRIDAFYSMKINTCVQVEITDSEKDWSYTLSDATYGFFKGPKVIKSEIPLTVYHHESYGRASAEGYWMSTDSNDGKQLASQIAARIECDREEHFCRESDATIFLGLLKPESHEYAISSWTPEGIVADDNDEGTCGIGHRLSIDFRSNSVVVVDYPKKINTADSSCSGFQNANSYSLHGGALGFMALNGLFNCTAGGVKCVFGKAA